jgi:hypothetical protein
MCCDVLCESAAKFEVMMFHSICCLNSLNIQVTESNRTHSSGDGSVRSIQIDRHPLSQITSIVSCMDIGYYLSLTIASRNKVLKACNIVYAGLSFRSGIFKTFNLKKKSKMIWSFGKAISCWLTCLNPRPRLRRAAFQL